MMQRLGEVVRRRSITSRYPSCNFLKKETLAQIFSYEFCKIFKNTYFIENLQTAASFLSRTIAENYGLHA